MIFGLTQKLGKNFIYRHRIEPKSSTYVPREDSFFIYKIYILRQNNFNYIDVAGKGRNSVLYYNFASEFVSMKRSQDSSAPNVL